MITQELDLIIGDVFNINFVTQARETWGIKWLKQITVTWGSIVARRLN